MNPMVIKGVECEMRRDGFLRFAKRFKKREKP